MGPNQAQTPNKPANKPQHHKAGPNRMSRAQHWLASYARPTNSRSSSCAAAQFSSPHKPAPSTCHACSGVLLSACQLQTAHMPTSYALVPCSPTIPSQAYLPYVKLQPNSDLEHAMHLNSIVSIIARHRLQALVRPTSLAHGSSHLQSSSLASLPRSSPVASRCTHIL